MKFHTQWAVKTWNPDLLGVTSALNPFWSALPADGHGDDDGLPAGVEEFSGGGDLPRDQHPKGAQRHKDCTHQRVGIVIVLWMGRKQDVRLRAVYSFIY